MTRQLFDPSFRLQQLELYNWGGFAGYHSAQIDEKGTAIVGPTGSGKTTVVDALMTLLGTNPKYNLASTGGHESDRDLVSYVRGVAGAGDGSGGQSHIARPGKTLTGICATLGNTDQQARLGALLWVDSSSSAASDVHKTWIFATGAGQSLQHWLTQHGEGGLRQLRQWAKDTEGVWLFHNNKRNYLARVRDFFEVRDNAFNLLNRAAGLKQLNSIDEIFRELVLDDCAQFERAREVADSFDDLTAIYQEIELARRQIRALEPVKIHHKSHLELDQKLREQELLVRLFPGWYAARSQQRWQQEWQRLNEAAAQAAQQLDEAERQCQQQDEQVQHLHGQFLQLGGSDIQTLQELIQRTEKERNQCERNAADYQRLTRVLELDDGLEQGRLLANQQQLKSLKLQWQQEADRQGEQVLNAGVSERRLLEEQQQQQAELDEVRRNPSSNIAPAFAQFRQQLADELDMDASELPFVAELVQVSQQEQQWRGAIERAIGSHRLRLLVPRQHMQQALAWVNGRDNRLHVRLLEVRPEPARNPEFFDDSFVHKLDFKSHAALHAVQQLLSGIDRHCVADVAQLQRVEHAMTKEGTLSGRAGYFDKQDQKRLQHDWQTGFDNSDRLQALERQLAETDAAVQAARQERQRLQGVSQQLAQRIHLADEILKVKFADLDFASQQRQLDTYQQQLARLTAPDSSLDAARKAYEQARELLKQLNADKTETDRKLARLQTLQQQAQEQLDSLAGRIDELPASEAGLFAAHEEKLLNTALSQLQTLERQLADELAQAMADAQNRLLRKEGELGKAMTHAKTHNQGALSEAGTELEDVPAYLERLQELVEEDLPARQKRFREYLNRSSEDGVVQLLSEINDEVERIRDRLEDVNATLRRVDFQQGRYLQIVARDVQHESRRTLTTAMEQLGHARYVEDDGEAHYRALQNIVMLLRDAVERQRTQAAKALLDPRFRLEFKVADICRHTDEIIETRSGSQGGSGGEKEIIASYVLTASLSYALCPDGSPLPLFATIVLDEAFSRSSHAVAGRIIDALNEFGLHPVFVTPNKEMRLLRNHTRSAIVVHRRGNESSMTSMSWRELGELAQTRQQKRTRHEAS